MLPDSDGSVGGPAGLPPGAEALPFWVDGDGCGGGAGRLPAGGGAVPGLQMTSGLK